MSGMFGTSWSLDVAKEHVERIERITHARRLYRAVCGRDVQLPAVPELPAGSEYAARRAARDALLLALRDGYIRATGRISTTPSLFPVSGMSGKWRLHATDLSLITTAEWREGEVDFSSDTLTGRMSQYMQIEVPDFMVMSIWPEPEQAICPAETASRVAYTTPYLELMQAAIANFRLTPENQSKKENLLDWFLTQQIEGEPVSNKLADAMATLVRLPSAQRGGAKRVIGPDLRKI